MRKSTGFALLGLFVMSLLLRILPLSGHLYWGADFGEYFFLTEDLLSNGSTTLPYYGWGFTYPYFPGLMILNGVIGLTDVSLPLVVSLVAVFLASFSIFPVFLIGRTLFHEDSASLIAAGVIAVSMPMVGIASHAIPGSIGDLLFVTGLLLFLKAQSNPKMYYLLYPMSIALVITHHLSTYFLIISLIAAVFLTELVSRKSDQRNLRLSIIYLIFLVSIAFLYWIAYATPFRDVVLAKLLGAWWLVLGVFVLAFPVLWALVKIRRRTVWQFRPKYPGLKSRFASLGVGLVTVYVIMAMNVYVSVPGTTITPSDWAFIYFTPLLVAFALGFPGRYFTDFLRKGLHITGWFIAIMTSLILATLFAREILIPYRHLQYMMPACALFIGLGISKMSGMMG
ncbi:MAG: hypothetical protein KAW09_05990, partial [Thermoplasmata archaeon]|nr:hypothetical protein [Thermoplasmata archaeon]